MAMESGTPLPVELPNKTLVNIHIHQESSLAYLCQAVGRYWARQQEAAAKDTQPAAAAPTPSARRCCGGGAQHARGPIPAAPCHTGSHPRGSPDLGGPLCSAKIPVATILNLASVIAASVALTYGIARIPNLQPFYDYKVEMCRRRVDPLRTTSSPGSSDYDWEDEQCKELLWHLLAVAFSVRVLLLIFSCIALGVALCCFAYGIRVMCLKARGGAYTKLQDQEVPLPYEDPGRPEALP
ncbi:hypothetical protein EYD10_17594 [Varanus komodoensis]|nr:hypothetical protein EYD10_17594 [Varanus komodoensis]